MARRFALISDIHANLTALDAALADIDAAGIRELYCLGDIVGYGRALHYVNAGSVGRPKDGDPRACWVEVSVSGDDLAAEIHRVDYDVETVARVIVALGLPATFAEALRTG